MLHLSSIWRIPLKSAISSETISESKITLFRYQRNSIRRYSNEHCVQVPSKTLLVDANLTIAYGYKYGFVGRNGLGKSAILKKIAARDGIPVFLHENEMIPPLIVKLDCQSSAGTVCRARGPGKRNYSLRVRAAR